MANVLLLCWVMEAPTKQASNTLTAAYVLSLAMESDSKNAAPFITRHLAACPPYHASDLLSRTCIHLRDVQVIDTRAYRALYMCAWMFSPTTAPLFNGADLDEGPGLVPLVSSLMRICQRQMCSGIQQFNNTFVASQIF